MIRIGSFDDLFFIFNQSDLTRRKLDQSYNNFGFNALILDCRCHGEKTLKLLFTIPKPSLRRWRSYIYVIDTM